MAIASQSPMDEVQIPIDLTLDNTQALQSTNRLIRAFNQLAEAVNGTEISDEFQEAFDTVRDFVAVNEDAVNSVASGNAEMVGDVRDMNNELRSMVDDLTDHFQRYGDARVQQLREQQAQEQLVEQEIQRVQGVITNVAQGTLTNMRNIMTRLGRLTTQIFRTGVAIVRSGLSKLGSIFFGGSRASDSFTGSLKRGLRTILSYGLGIVSLTSLFNKLRSAAMETIQRMAKQLPEVNRDMSALTNSIQNLKNSVGTAFQPLLAAITPVLTRIIDLLTKAITKVGEFIAAITGQKYVYKATAANIDYAKSLDKSTKAAKKNQNQLGEYDKLKVIGKKDDGSGADDADARLGTFKKVPIDPKIMKWVDWLKDMWRRGDFFELGAKFAKWLKNLLRQIPWDKIKAFMGKLGKSIASFFNGIFADLELAWELGNAVAQAFNSVLTLAYEFVKEFDFKQFGKFVGTFISSALSQIDWDMLKDFAKRLGKGIADAIRGLTETNVIREIGNAIGNLLRAAIDFAFELATNIPFEEITKEIIRGLNALFDRLSDVDETGKSGWAKLGEAISTLVIGILHMINEVLGNPELRTKLKTGLVEFLNSIDFATIISEANDLLLNVISGIIMLIGTALSSDTVRQGLIALIPNLFLGVFSIALMAAIGRQVASRFLQGIVRGIAEGWVSSGVTATTTTAATGTVEAAGAAATTSAMTVAAGLVSGLLAFFSGAELGKFINESIWPEDSEMMERYHGITGTFRLLADFLTTLGSELWYFFTDIGNGIVNGVRNAINKVVGWINDLGTKLANNPLGQKVLGFFGGGSQVPVNTSRMTTAGVGTYLAKGNVVPANNSFLSSMMESSQPKWASSLQDAVQNNSNKQPIVLQLDGRTVAETVWDEENKRYKQTGQYRPRTT